MLKEKTIRIIKNIILKCKQIIIYLVGSFFYFANINKTKVVALNLYGMEPGGNILCVVNNLVTVNPEVEVVWLVREIPKNTHNSKIKNKNIKYVKYKSLRALYELSTARVWLDNSRKFFTPVKKEGQVYFQFWHGGLGIKKIEKDALSSLNNFYVWLARKDSLMTDYMISNSRHLTNIYKGSFWYNGPILEYGYPEEFKLLKDFEVRQDNNINKSQLNILFAPTFRDYEYNPLNLNFHEIVTTLEQETNKTVNFYIKNHPISNYNNYAKYLNKQIKDISAVGDIQSHMLQFDLLITDYSSIMFDALISGLPAVLYIPDQEQYFEKRGSYFNIDDLPFPHALTTIELVKEIKSFDYAEYLDKRTKFLHDVGYIDSSDSTTQITNKINEYLSNGGEANV